MLQRSAFVEAVGTASPSLKCRVLAYLYSHSFFPIPPPHKFPSCPHLSTQLRHTTPINCRYEEKKSYQIVLCPVTKAKRTVMNAPPKLDYSTRLALFAYLIRHLGRGRQKVL